MPARGPGGPSMPQSTEELRPGCPPLELRGPHHEDLRPQLFQRPARGATPTRSRGPAVRVCIVQRDGVGLSRSRELTVMFDLSGSLFICSVHVW